MRVLVLFIVALAASAQTKESFVFENVTIVDGTGAPARPRMRLVVHNGLIQSISPSDGSLKLSDGSQVIDARGKFLIPGLWDMHVHLNRPSDLPLYVANGVTGVRVMRGEFSRVPDEQDFPRLRRQIEAAEVLGPRL